MSIILDGKLVSDEINSEIITEIKYIKEKYKSIPKVVIVSAGNDPVLNVYARAKERKFIEIGFSFEHKKIEEEFSTKKIIDLIKQLNDDNTVNGIIIEMPLPKVIDSEKVINSIDPDKDVDCLHPFNVGNIVTGRDNFLKPCTSYGIMKLMEYYKINTERKHVIIINRSNLIGKPIMSLLVQNKKNANATVTICHSKTKNLEEIILLADIIVVAVGKANFIKSHMIKKGAIVIDAGINKIKLNENDKKYKIVGDVDYDSVKDIASFITPVPGGVGPMNVAILMKNILTAYKLQNNLLDRNKNE